VIIQLEEGFASKAFSSMKNIATKKVPESQKCQKNRLGLEKQRKYLVLNDYSKFNLFATTKTRFNIFLPISAQNVSRVKRYFRFIRRT